MSREDEVRDVINETAQQIAELQSNPRTWLSWTVYFLEQLEGQATKQNPDMVSFKEMLSALQSEIRNRLKTGGWH
jgi:hypothetical protein